MYVDCFDREFLRTLSSLHVVALWLHEDAGLCDYISQISLTFPFLFDILLAFNRVNAR